LNKFELKEILENGVVTVVFEKVDGSIREMKCTLLTEYLPVSDKQLLTENTTRKENDSSISVWDVESNGWRAFRLDSIKEIRN
jgi:hypothetical protein